MKTKLAFGIAIAMLAVACSSQMPHVDVQGDAVEVASLVGKWGGEYSSPASGRSGSISFELEEGELEAHGDVVMVPKHRASAEHESMSGDARGKHVVATQQLTIRFVRLGGGWVSGHLNPYIDPECGCELRTFFEGKLTGDAIEGTYRSLGHDHETVGRWRVERVR